VTLVPTFIAGAKPGGAVVVVDGESAASGGGHAATCWTTNTFTVAVVAFQAAMIVLFATCTNFDGSLSPQNAPSAGSQIGVQYAMWADTHVMMAIGFGALYLLLRRNMWTPVS
jgi:hypothetical protein